MATAPLAIDYDSIRAEIARLIGWDRTPGNWSTEQANDAEACIQSGLRKFYYPAPIDGRPAYRWSFLEPLYDFTTQAPYSTGTVEVASGVVTRSGGGDWSTFDPATSSYPITDAWFLYNGARYSIASYDGAAQITLDDTSLTVAAGASYELRWYRYTLPATYAGFNGEMTYRPGETDEYHTVRRVAEEQIREAYQDDWITTATDPECYATVAKSFVATGTQRWFLYLYPESTTSVKLQVRMRVNPENLDGTNKYPLGGPEHAETVLEAILSEVEVKLMDQPGPHSKLFHQCLLASISHDKQSFAPDYLPAMPPVGSQEYYDWRLSILSKGTCIPTGYEAFF